MLDFVKAMRVFPFLIVVALSIEAFVCDTLCRSTISALFARETAFPGFAVWVFNLHERGLFWSLPVVFSIYAFFISFRNTVSVGSVLVFAGLALICAMLLLGSVLIAQQLSLHPVQGHFCNGVH